jgi:toluene monooxygenase system protein E
MTQDGQENFVFGLFDQFNSREHDKSLDSRWAGTLARLYTPARYLFHTLQMASAYCGQVAPASTITNCNYFQMADSLRWLSHTAYRTKELSMTFADKGFTVDERSYWESDAAWQGFRELMEKVLSTWDWAEAFVALNLVAKPAIDEAVLRKLGESARHNGDMLLGLVNDAQLVDAARHRRWACALVKMALEKPGNADVIKGWIAKWEPLADQAIEAYCAALADVANAAPTAKQATRDFRKSLGL